MALEVLYVYYSDISEGISSKKTKFNPDEKDMQAIINAKSSHDWEVTEVGQLFCLYMVL